MIYGYELKKLTGMTKMLWIYLGLLIATVAIQVAVVRVESRQMDSSEIYYKEYMKSLEGKITPEKEKYMLSERTRINEALEKEEEMKNLYREGKISEQEYINYNDERLYAEIKDKGFARVEDTYSQISENGGWFVYDTEWNRLFTTDIYGFLLVLFLSSVFAMYVGNEYASGMWQYLDSASNGREKTISAKCFMAVISAMVLSIIYFFLRYGLFFVIGDIPLANAPLCSLSMFYHVGNSFSIGTFFVITALLQAVAATGLVLVIMFAAYLSKNGITAMAVGLGVYFIPFLVKQYSGEIFSFSFCGTINLAESLSLLQNKWQHTVIICLAPVLFLMGILLMCIYRKISKND